tara:strand:- start:388 stop:699 length:312 start_codon:yes stop_codon:yes gene_type:complete
MKVTELTIKKGEFLEFIKESKSYTEFWPAWKKESIQAVSCGNKSEQVSRYKSTSGLKKGETMEMNDEEIWMAVFLAAIAAGKTATDAADVAAEALNIYVKEWA